MLKTSLLGILDLFPRKEFTSWDIFICYHRDDISDAKFLFEGFASREIKSWFDEEEIAPGEIWGEKMHQGLTRSKCILVLLGEELGGTQSREIEIALYLLGSSRISIVPVHLPSFQRTEKSPHAKLFEDLGRRLPIHLNEDWRQDDSRIIQQILRPLEQRKRNAFWATTRKASAAISLYALALLGLSMGPAGCRSLLEKTESTSQDPIPEPWAIHPRARCEAICNSLVGEEKMALPEEELRPSERTVASEQE